MASKKLGRRKRNSRTRGEGKNSGAKSANSSFQQYSRYSRDNASSGESKHDDSSSDGLGANSGSSRENTVSNSSSASANNALNRTYTDLPGADLGEIPYRSKYSRDAYGSTATTGDHRASKSYSGHKRSKKPIFITLLIVFLVIAIGAGAAFAYLNTINHKLSTGVDADLLEELQDTQYTGEPFYALLLGIDKDEERNGSDEFGDTFRTDSMMLARVDPKQKKATLISIPRDTMVDMEENGTQKINAAYAIGGPAYAVKMVSKLAGVSISHYAEIDFDGFAGIVDGLGGIEVNVPTAIDDDQAGGSLNAGLQTLDGGQALILCRSRHTYDDQGAGDLYRAANQRTVLGAIAKKLLNSDPVTIVNTVGTAANFVTTDLSVADLVAMANSMRGMDPSTDIYSAAVPTTSQYVGEVWYEMVDNKSWTAMMQRVDQGLSPTTTTVVDASTGVILQSSGDGTTSSTYGSSSSSTSNSGTSTNSNANVVNQKYTGSVAVRNGTGTSGVASAAAQKIAALGFTTETGNADSSTYTKTLVIYTNSSQAQAAAAIVSALGVGSTQVNDGTYILKDDFLVVIGSDYK